MTSTQMLNLIATVAVGRTEVWVEMGSVGTIKIVIVPKISGGIALEVRKRKLSSP
jgi:hypothetical protein